MKLLKNERFKTFLVIFSLFIYTFLVTFFSIANNDVIWNYGFSFNVANNLKMYKDFNMVITPLYPTIFGIIMKLLGKNMIVFYLSNSLVATSIFYIVYKNYKKVFIEMILLVSLISGPNYNSLCLLFLFLLLLLEEKNKNDYLIGILLGLTFLTKSSMGLLSLASIYYIKDFKKLLKRVVGFLIPNLLFILYFIKTNILSDYINYAFGSLFDFATRNSNLSIGVIIFIISIIYLIKEYRKNKDIKVLYILLFQIMSYPIFNYLHIVFSLIPILFYILLKSKNKLYLKYRKYLLILLICPILSTIFQMKFMDMSYGTNALKYKPIETKYITDAKTIKNKLGNLDNLYFIMYEGYYNKLLLGLDINKYDVMLNGNLGYNGVKNTIKYFKYSPNGTKFIMYNTYEGGQAPKEVYDFIKNNYRVYKTFDKYIVYVK